MKYYGLFVKVEGEWRRLGTESYTLETAKRRWVQFLFNCDAKFKLKALPPVKQLDVKAADRKYANTPWR